ncbi:hypothetical protein LBMAG33_0100 [Candidatus Levyibacteriota bacterium]|nr:DUF192 domain-containing protein [Candidatus Levybacteria bacterium]MSU25694.1 DUF192 domain-containing protein [Candidatus Levybacteria bacterium]GDX61700.1 hypothetical protein LBMAG33_0100 [Candidatus Levybacteria bacterium]
MKNSSILLLFLALIIIFLIDRYSSIINLFPLVVRPFIIINSHRFKIISANTPISQEVGLSTYTSLPIDKGMLFTFEKADYYNFWMKNMKIPIDIIFINGDSVVTIFQNVQPPTTKDQKLPLYKPEKPSDSVLEINAGLTNKYNIKKNDKVKIYL